LRRLKLTGDVVRYLVQIHVGLDDRVAWGIGRHLELAGLLHLHRLQHDLLHVDADLTPLVHEQMRWIRTPRYDIMPRGTVARG
jgi:hypothetical protein